MNEDALRALVRDTIARLTDSGQPPASRLDDGQPVPLGRHASHYRYSTLPETDGPCLIEPSVQCTHCGYCQSHGH